MQDVELKNHHFAEKIEKLRELVVDEADARNILALNQELESKLNELREREAAIESNGTETLDKIGEIVDICQQIEVILVQFSGLLEQFGKMEAELVALNAEIAKIEREVHETDEEIVKVTDDVREKSDLGKMNQEELSSKLLEYNLQLNGLNEVFRDKKKLYDGANTEAIKVRKQLNAVKEKLEKVVVIGNIVTEKACLI